MYVDVRRGRRLFPYIPPTGKEEGRMPAKGALDARNRSADLSRLADGQLDVLVIGGGVTGAGAALDAASRGLRVALVEARDLVRGHRAGRAS